MRKFSLCILALLAGCTIGAQWQALDSAPQETARIGMVSSYEVTPDDSHWGRLFAGPLMVGTYYAHEVVFADGSTRHFDIKAQYFNPGACIVVRRSKDCLDQCKLGVNLQIVSPTTCPADFPQGKSPPLIR
jgi:hypothetical protein